MSSINANQNAPKSPLTSSLLVYENERDTVELKHRFQKPTYTTRAKYYPTRDGGYRLAQIQSFNEPRFTPPSKMITRDDGVSFYVFDGEADEGDDVASAMASEEKTPLLMRAEDIIRATRRARISAFDKIACNDDMTLFSTLTFDPSRLRGEVDAYQDVYRVLRPWLSNLVCRHGFKYVIAPERHKSGGIHFHMISNDPGALRLDRACSARTGRPLTHGRKPLFNLNSWKHGHSSAEFIGEERLDRDKVAKYIFKYMGKQAGQKIGGRYLLTGGEFAEPIYAYGTAVEEFLDGDSVCRFDKEVKTTTGVVYREFSYI